MVAKQSSASARPGYCDVVVGAVFLLGQSDSSSPEDAMRGYVEAGIAQDCEAEMRFHSERTLGDHPLEQTMTDCEREWLLTSDEEIADVRNTTISEVTTLDEGTTHDGVPFAEVRIITTGPDGSDDSLTSRMIEENDKWVLEHVSPTGEGIDSLDPTTPAE